MTEAARRFHGISRTGVFNHGPGTARCRGIATSPALQPPARVVSPDHGLARMTSISELTMLGGERYRVRGEAKAVERVILDAARGSLMQFAWLTDAESGEQVGVNPEHVVMLKGVGSEG